MDYDKTLPTSPLFEGIEIEQLPNLLDCLQAVRRDYKRDAYIFAEGDAAQYVGMVLSGSAQVVREDVFGNRNVRAFLLPPDLFGETFACADVAHLPVSVMAVEKSTILLMDYKKIIHTCPNSCVFHARLIDNMLRILAQKNLLLNANIEVLSARSMRAKVMAYLSLQAKSKNSMHIHIPFSRQQLADHLAVDRSALSAELSRMQSDGLIRYHKNEFWLLG